jgi:hypothetical protein
MESDVYYGIPRAFERHPKDTCNNIDVLEAEGAGALFGQLEY